MGSLACTPPTLASKGAPLMPCPVEAETGVNHVIHRRPPPIRHNMPWSAHRAAHIARFRRRFVSALMRGSVFAPHTHSAESLMDRTFKLAVGGAAVVVLLLVLFYGPLVTAFIVAGSSFALMIAMIAMSGIHAIGRWRRRHPLLLHRPRTH